MDIRGLIDLPTNPDLEMLISYKYSVHGFKQIEDDDLRGLSHGILTQRLMRSYFEKVGRKVWPNWLDID